MNTLKNFQNYRSKRISGMRGKRLLPMMLVLVGLATGDAAATDNAEYADLFGQGLQGPVVAVDGIKLLRKKSQLLVNVRMATPAPGSYNYPPGNFWNNDAIPGSPEAFSMWAFVFNEPSLCRSDPNGGPYVEEPMEPTGFCTGADAINGTEGAGAFNIAGHLVTGPVLQLSGVIAFTSEPFSGAPLTDPDTAEVHIAIAPHGALQPEKMPNQIQTPIGGPDFWWLGGFFPVR